MTIENTTTATAAAVRLTLREAPRGTSVDLLCGVQTATDGSSEVEGYAWTLPLLKRCQVGSVCLLSDEAGRIWTFDLSRTWGEPFRCEDGTLEQDCGAVEIVEDHRWGCTALTATSA